MSVLDKMLRVTMPNGEQWDVPVRAIAVNRADVYAHEFDGDLSRSLAEDTVPLFDADEYEIKDWAANNMNWRDVRGDAVRVATQRETDFQAGWVNGEKRIVDGPA